MLPVGATRAERVDLRIVAASNRDLIVAVASGDFRGDLYARLAGFTVALPPLRERREDLGLIVGALLRRLAPDRKLVLSHGAARGLFARSRPTNVRELESALGVAFLLAAGDMLDLGDASPTAAASGAPQRAPSAKPPRSANASTPSSASIVAT